MPESQAFTQQHTIKMYATTWCGDCRMAKRWFDGHAIPYVYINIETAERAAAEVLRLNRGMRSVPTIVFPDGSVLVEPSARTGRQMLAGTRALARRTPEKAVQRRREERELEEAFLLASLRVYCIHWHFLLAVSKGAQI